MPPRDVNARTADQDVSLGDASKREKPGPRTNRGHTNDGVRTAATPPDHTRRFLEDQLQILESERAEWLVERQQMIVWRGKYLDALKQLQSYEDFVQEWDKKLDELQQKEDEMKKLIENRFFLKGRLEAVRVQLQNREILLRSAREFCSRQGRLISELNQQSRELRCRHQWLFETIRIYLGGRRDRESILREWRQIAQDRKIPAGADIVDELESLPMPEPSTPSRPSPHKVKSPDRQLADPRALTKSSTLKGSGDKKSKRTARAVEENCAPPEITEIPLKRAAELGSVTAPSNGLFVGGGSFGGDPDTGLSVPHPRGAENRRIVPTTGIAGSGRDVKRKPPAEDRTRSKRDPSQVPRIDRVPRHSDPAAGFLAGPTGMPVEGPPTESQSKPMLPRAAKEVAQRRPGKRTTAGRDSPAAARGRAPGGAVATIEAGSASQIQKATSARMNDPPSTGIRAASKSKRTATTVGVHRESHPVAPFVAPPMPDRNILVTPDLVRNVSDTITTATSSSATPLDLQQLQLHYKSAAFLRRRQIRNTPEASLRLPAQASTADSSATRRSPSTGRTTIIQAAPLPSRASGPAAPIAGIPIKTAILELSPY